MVNPRLSERFFAVITLRHSKMALSGTGRAKAVANCVIVSGALVCIGTLCFFVYHYTWIRDRSFASPAAVWMNYIFPAVLAGLLLLCLRLQPSMRIRLALTLVFLAFAVFSVETFMTLTADWSNSPARFEYTLMDERRKLAQKFGVEFDSRTRREVVADLRKNGIEAYPPTPFTAVNINGRAVLPLGGIGNKVVVLCNEGGDYIRYRADERGFHNSTGFWSTDRIDIAVLGDSFAEGFCVPSEKNFVALIREQYSGTLNLGKYGDGPLLELAKLKEYLPPRKPKVVLWFYSEKNDLYDLGGEKKDPLLTRYLALGFTQGLVNLQPDIDRALIAHVEAGGSTENPKSIFEWLVETAADKNWLWAKADGIFRLGHLRQQLGLIYGETRLDNETQSTVSRADQTVIDLFAQILSQANESVRLLGGKLYFVYLPQWERYGKPERVNPDRDRVLMLVRQLHIPLIDIDPAFRETGDPLGLFPFRGPGHYNAEGHRLVAREVLRHVASTKKLSQN